MKTFLYIHKPKILWKAQVALAYSDPEYPLNNFLYDRTSFGSPSSTKDGMTMLLGRTEGADDLGRQHLTSTPVSGVISIGYSSYGNHDGEIMIDDYLLSTSTSLNITVLEEYRVWAKIPALVGVEVWPEGGLPVSDRVQEPPPKANGGPAIGGTINPTSGKLRVNFDGTRSFQFSALADNNWDFVNGYNWNIKDGTFVSGTVSSSAPVVDFPPGFRYVDLTVTAANGKGHQIHIPVFARDPANDQTTPHQVMSHSSSPKGQDLLVRLFNNLDKTLYPDGMMCIMWEEDSRWSSEPVAGTKTLFYGWHVSDNAGSQVGNTGRLRDLTMRFVDVNGRLSMLPGFTQIKASLQSYSPPKSSANNWNDARYNNVLYYLWHLLYWFSTALEVSDLLVDYIRGTLLTFYLAQYKFIELGSEDNTLYDQVNTLLNNITPDHYLCCTNGGSLIMSPDLMIMPEGDRVDFEYSTGQITSNEWTDITVEWNRPPRVAELISGAVVSSSTYLIVDGEKVYPLAFSLAPGVARGQGAQKSTLGSRITLSQELLNACEGNRYARLNSPYGPITVTMPYAAWLDVRYDLDPAFMKEIAVSIATVYPTPLYNETFLCVIQDITFSYSYDATGIARQVRVTLERETSGPPALTFVPLPEDDL
jgi:hypothetical protein